MDSNNVLAFPAEDTLPIETAPAAKTKTRKKKGSAGQSYVNGQYYRVSMMVIDQNTGIKKQKFFYGRKMAEAKAKRKAYQDELARKGVVTASKVTFDQMLQVFLAEKKDIEGRSYNLIRKYELLAKHLQPISGMRLKDIKHRHIQAVVVDLAEKGYAADTLRTLKSIAKQVFELAIVNDYVDSNPALRVKIPVSAPVTAEKQPLSVQAQKLVLAAAMESSPHRMAIPALIMLFCGLRRGECAALLWRDIDLDAAVVNVNKSLYFDNNDPREKTPKTAAGARSVPIPVLIIPILRAARNALEDSINTKNELKAKAQAADTHVMLSDGGAVVTKSSVGVGWASYQRHLARFAAAQTAADAPVRAVPPTVERFTSHQCRHSYASNLYAAGVDEMTRKLWLGHSRGSSNDVTDAIYTHVIDQLLTDAKTKYNAFCTDNFAGSKSAKKEQKSAE